MQSLSYATWHFVTSYTSKVGKTSRTFQKLAFVKKKTWNRKYHYLSILCERDTPVGSFWFLVPYEAQLENWD